MIDDFEARAAYDDRAARVHNHDDRYRAFGPTADRPDNLTLTETGYFYFDTTLGMPIWWKGATSSWVKADGTAA